MFTTTPWRFALSFLLLVPVATAQGEPAELVKWVGQGVAHELFGVSVAISGDHAIVGSAGMVYTYSRGSDGGWDPGEPLASAGVVLGNPVALDGRFAVAAATYDAGSVTPTRKVHVYELDADGEWEEMQVLSSPVGAGESFAASVAIDGERIAVGSPHWRGPLDEYAGAVDIFSYDSASGWTHEQSIPGTATGHVGFGYSLALSGSDLVVGAPYCEFAGFAFAGLVRVYERTAAGTMPWELRTTFASEVPFAFECFGAAVAMDADTFIVTSRLGVSVFERVGAATAWSRAEKLSTADGSILRVAAVSGGRLVASADLDSVYVFEKEALGGWDERMTLTASDGRPGQLYGAAVAIDRDRVVVGAPGGGAAWFAGAAYLIDTNPLTGSAPTASVSTGDVIRFEIDAGMARAHMPFLIAGTTSGTTPGIPFAGRVLPVNYDWFFEFTLMFPNTPPLLKSIGFTNEVGFADAAFHSAMLQALVGTRFDLIAVVYDPDDPSEVIKLVSNPEGVLITR